MSQINQNFDFVTCKFHSNMPFTHCSWMLFVLFVLLNWSCTNVLLFTATFSYLSGNIFKYFDLSSFRRDLFHYKQINRILDGWVNGRTGLSASKPEFELYSVQRIKCMA